MLQIHRAAHLIFLWLLCFTQASAISISFDKTRLEQNASRFGYKAANLEELERIAQELNKEGRSGVQCNNNIRKFSEHLN